MYRKLPCSRANATQGSSSNTRQHCTALSRAVMKCKNKPAQAHTLSHTVQPHLPFITTSMEVQTGEGAIHVQRYSATAGYKPTSAHDTQSRPTTFSSTCTAEHRQVYNSLAEISHAQYMYTPACTPSSTCLNQCPAT